MYNVQYAVLRQITELQLADLLSLLE